MADAGAELIDLEHWRRALRLVPILVDRFGASYFVDDDDFDDVRVARCVDLAVEWISRRSGRDVERDLRARLPRLLRTTIRARLREAAASRRS